MDIDASERRVRIRPGLRCGADPGPGGMSVHGGSLFVSSARCERVPGVCPAIISYRSWEMTQTHAPFLGVVDQHFVIERLSGFATGREVISAHAFS